MRYRVVLVGGGFGEDGDDHDHHEDEQAGDVADMFYVMEFS